MTKQNYPFAGEIKTAGYVGEAIDYTVEEQYLDDATWTLHVDQFRYKTDTDNGWRGEFWGKMMRGAALTYRATKNKALYDAMSKTVEDLLSTAEASGRISSYPQDKEFYGWDMWGRKYVMLGLQYYLDVCRSEKQKRRIISALKRHANYIMKHIGEGRGRRSIFSTSNVWGALNSCSILEPYVKLYNLTGDKKYLDFSSYIVGTGFCEDMNLIELCLGKELYPYQFTYTKAYEMMSCFEGLLEYYKVLGNPDHLLAVENFVEMVAESDYTIIGCSGCTHELFDNSAKMQTEPTNEVMQETCVTVTFMKLCAKLFAITGKAFYIELIEKSGYNAMLGAVNDTNQTMHTAEGRKWVGDECLIIPHEPFPFDSYSPLYHSRRARRVGGFMQLQNGRSYGCCACIGGAGTAILGLSAITKGDNSLNINLYQQVRFKSDMAKIAVFANPYGKSGAKLRVDSDREFTLRLRVPSWAKDFTVSVDGETLNAEINNGYIELFRKWSNECIKLDWKMPVTAHILNGKIAYTRGAVTLARDCRLDDIEVPVSQNTKDGRAVRAKVVKNGKFKNKLTVEIATKEGVITLCDYSSAGKNFDDENCNITVWQNRK